MSTIDFTTSSGLTINFTNNDLDLVLTTLATSDTYYSVGKNNLNYIMLGNGYLLIIDISTTTNRKLFESFHFSASNLFPFQLKLTNNSTASVLSIDEALVASGYSGVTPINSLASIHMKLYIQSGSNIDVYSKDQVNQLLLSLVDNAPTNLDTLNELALALQNASNEDNNNMAYILGQLATKLNTINPNYTGILKNPDDSFRVDASGNLTCHNATFNGLVSGLTMDEINGLIEALNAKANLSGCTFTGTVNGITKQMVGLSNVDNTSDSNKVLTQAQITGLVADLSSKQPVLTTNSVPISYVSGLQASLDSLQPKIGTGTLSIANTSGLQPALDSKANLSGCTFTGTVNGISKAMVGLSNVDNVADANKTFTQSQITGLVTDLASKADQLTTYTKNEINTSLHSKANLSGCTFTGPVNGITKSMVGLSNVDNVADASKVFTQSQITGLVTDLASKANQATTYTKTEVDNSLNLKANQLTTYSKSEMDTALGLKSDKSNTYTKTEVDNSLGLKANQLTTYTKTEVDTAVATKANQSTTYSKTEVDTALNLKADKTTTYTKTELDTFLTAKANQSTTYSKTEVDNSLALKADQSTTYTKTQVDNSLALKANQSTTYTKAEVDTSLASKANQSTTYSKTEVENSLASKANQLTTYTKAEVDASLNGLLTKSNPTYTGSLTGPLSTFVVDANGNLSAFSVMSSNNITCTDVIYAGGTSLTQTLDYWINSLNTKYQPKLTNLNNINNNLTSVNALIPTFTPTDTPTLVLSAGSFLSNQESITNTWNNIENKAQRLTLTAGTFDMYFQVPTTGLSGQTLVIKVWVKLGTATNFCLTVNNTQTWTGAVGKRFTSTDGLNASTYTQLSFSFTAPAYGAMNVHVGGHSASGIPAQSAGTVFTYGWQIFVKGKNSTLQSNLTVDGTATASDVLFGSVGYSLNSCFGFARLSLATLAMIASGTPTTLTWNIVNATNISVSGPGPNTGTTIVLPTAGTYVFSGKILNNTGVNGCNITLNMSNNGGSTWNPMSQTNSTSLGGDIAIYGMVNAGSNAQVQLVFSQSTGSSVNLSTQTIQSFCNVYKVAPF